MDKAAVEGGVPGNDGTRFDADIVGISESNDSGKLHGVVIGVCDTDAEDGE